MKAIAAIHQFQKELRDFGAEQFGTDNMQTTQACIEAVTALSRLIGKINDEALQSAEWPSQRR
jgi:CHAD domain-containing protein